jgi:putative transposase
MVTVRAVHRLFLFVPTDTVNALIEYLVAYAAEQHGVGVVSMCWLSNHAHLVVNDHLGVVPDFVQTLNMLLARALNALRGDHGSVFERGNVDYKTIDGAGAAVTAIAYVAANPVEAGCVEYGREWPGVRSHIKDMGGREREVQRIALTVVFGAKNRADSCLRRSLSEACPCRRGTSVRDWFSMV